MQAKAHLFIYLCERMIQKSKLMSGIFIKNWYIYLFNGIIAVLYGLLALFVPFETLQTLSWYAGFVILLSGVLMLLVTVNRIRKKQDYFWILLQSVLYIAAGTLILLYTQEAIRFFVISMGVLALIVGVLQLIVLVNINPVFRFKNFMLFNALITMAFGVLMLYNPFRVAEFLVTMSGVLALFYGIVLIWFSINLYRLTKQLVD